MELERIEQELGYLGKDRFVMFYYEPSLNQVRWRDSRSMGSGCTGWPPRFAGIEASARSAGFTLGNFKGRGDHVLLVDRVDRQVCFAYREEAQEFLARQCETAA
jgi:hypothetical protein